MGPLGDATDLGAAQGFEFHDLAWNPSVTGAKAEDTIIVTWAGPEVITVSDNWPVFHLDLEGTKVPTPDILTL